jgi:hypothetical protein
MRIQQTIWGASLDAHTPQKKATDLDSFW